MSDNIDDVMHIERSGADVCVVPQIMSTVEWIVLFFIASRMSSIKMW